MLLESKFRLISFLFSLDWKMSPSIIFISCLNSQRIDEYRHGFKHYFFKKKKIHRERERGGDGDGMGGGGKNWYF